MAAVLNSQQVEQVKLARLQKKAELLAEKVNKQQRRIQNLNLNQIATRPAEQNVPAF